MPVKNIKRRTNDGLQGTIVGLTKEEKQALIKDGIASSEDVDKLVKEMPTDINVDANGFAILEHDGAEITGQKKKVKFAQIDKSASFNQVTIPTASSLKTVDGTGLGLNILSLNLKDCMNESDFNELIGYVLQKTVIAKTYNITLPDLTGIDVVKFTTETSLGNMTQIFYRNSKAISQFNWLCNWIDNENFMQMMTITGFTDDAVTSIKYNGIEQVDVTDMPTDLKATTTNLSLLAGSTKIGSGINLSGFEYDEATNTLKASGGGGASVSPTLNLMNMEDLTVRTSITEEEKNNLDKGLYNSVIYADLSAGEAGIYSIYFPETGAAVEGEGFIFSTYNVMTPEGTNVHCITGSSSYQLTIAEKNDDGVYPIVITKQITAQFGTSPRLNLIDTSRIDPVVRTSITQEEAQNLALGLYNSVFYYDVSSPESISSVYFPESLIYYNKTTEEIIFSVFNILGDATSGTHIISSSSVYKIKPGNTNEDGTIQITIEKLMDVPFGGGGGGSSTSIAFQDVTVSELANHIGEFGNFHITDLKLVYDSFLGPQEFMGGYFIGTVASSTELAGVMWVVVDTQSNQAAYYKSDNFSISNGKIILQQNETLGVIKSLPFPKKINSQDGYNFLSEVIDTGSIVYAGEADIDSSSISHLILGLSSNVVPTATGDEEYCHFDCIVEEKGIGRLSLKKDANNIPQFKSFTTWLPPVTSASEGKALIVTDGNAQWTTTPRYEHTITIKNSAGKILWTQTMRNSSNTIVNSYANLKTLFGGATYAGFGEYCQLDLRGGTEATDKLIKLDGTEATLASLGAIVYTDVCFLPK